MKSQANILLILAASLLISSCKKKNETKTTEPTLAGLQLSTSPVTSITDISAVGGGAIISEGESAVLEAGLCWDTLPGTDINRGWKIKATSTGNYTCAITNLKLYTKYYVRAYASNSEGTSYGSEISFTSADIWKLQAVASSTFSEVSCMKAIGGKIYLGSDKGLFVSTNGGDSWEPAGFANSYVHAIGVSEDRIVVALLDHSLYKTEDGGKTWVNMLPASNDPFIADILLDGNVIYRTEYKALYKSTDGSTWVKISPSVSAYQYTRLMKFSNTIYTPADSYTALYKTSTDGANWQTTTDLKFGVSVANPPDIDHVGDKLLFGTGKGLYFSKDEGEVWTKYNDLPTEYALISVLGQTVFSASGTGLYCNISYDEGNSWIPFSTKGIQAFHTPVTDVLLCKESIFIFSAYDHQFYRYRR